METILIVIHLMIVIALVIVVLLQRSEGGALGIGGGGGGLMSARGAANALTRTTGILAAAFFITSLSLGILARYGGQPTDILDRLPTNQGGSVEGGSLLDQLGTLPEQDAPANEADQTRQTGAATDTAPSDPNAPSAAPSLPEDTGSAVGQPAPAEDASTSTVTPAPEIPANPAPSAPNAAEDPTVPPVEAPPAGVERPVDGGTSPSGTAL